MLCTPVTAHAHQLSTPTTRSRRRPATALALALASATVVGGCGSPGSDTPSSAPSTTVSASAPSAASSSSVASCPQRIAGELTWEQKAGQLVMPALDAGAGQAGLDTTITKRQVTGIFYLGGWRQASVVGKASAHVQSLAPKTASGRIGMLVAADQEGGQIQQLKGQGFPDTPPATALGGQSASAMTPTIRAMGKALAAAGVNVDLAPVGDTVPAELGAKNEPIGKWNRQFGSDPKAVSRHTLAFAQALRSAKVQPVVKHFPGIGRITANTDFSAEGITDTVATAKDPYLAPFATAAKAKLPMIMVSNARYSKLDATNPAPFSSAIINTLLRKQIGFSGVVLSDDLGVAKAVVATPAKERAARFVAAGGDIALTGQPIDVPAMVAGIVERAKKDQAFAAKVDASVNRVLAMKAQMGLLRCS